MYRGLVVAVLAWAGCHAGQTRPAAAGLPTEDTTDDPPDDPEDASDRLPTADANATAGSAHGAAALLAEARRELARTQTSHYVHHTHVDEASGTFEFDCSGFVDYALSRAAPAALRELQAATVERPLAKHFEATLASATDPARPWLHIDRVGELGPGDVIAWLEPPAKRSRNTGHVMIVAAPPSPGARAGEWVVAVIDSSRSGHGTRDARVRDHRDGLGSGEIVLLVDADDHPVGFRWSTRARSAPYRTEVAMGRLRPGY